MKNKILTGLLGFFIAILIITVSIGLPIYVRPFYYLQVDLLDFLRNRTDGLEDVEFLFSLGVVEALGEEPDQRRDAEDENGDATMYYPDAVRYNEQNLTDEQKEQARTNIKASSVTFDTNTKTLNICSGGAINSEELAGYASVGIKKITVDGVEIVNLEKYISDDMTTREDWVFTLEDGSTVTKKMLILNADEPS